jgi:phosphopantetheine adenylyltransferase
MFVHFGRIFAVAQKFEQVVIGQEVEPWKGSSFCLQERIQHLLRFIQAFRDVIEVSVEILDKESRQNIWFRMIRSIWVLILVLRF